MNDDDLRVAFELHEQGLGWAQIGRELGCTAPLARLAADAYRRRTDAAAAADQYSLFDAAPE
ncbi:hypothetical protein [Rhodococcus rhodnii]|uniref:hypothetical protein n=1 Tax=Rhodococcus rhodnii TaxID=38312 RepID=UPI000934A7A3|nr:hypothetical protein [Rhodococcus rhodnii]